MNKKIVVTMAVFIGITILLASSLIKNNKREVITITPYASMVERSLDELIGVADLIVVGDFLNTYPSRWNTANGRLPDDATIELVSQQRLRIFTDSNFQVAQYLKGDVQSPVIRIRTMGGQVGEDSMIVSGQPVYEIGQTYLLFLYYNTGATADIDPGSYYGSSILYEITDGKAVSVKDEWILEDLIAYIEKSLFTDESTSGPGFVLSSDIPDTYEAKEIIKTIEKSYDIGTEAAYTLDLSKFPSVFINDPRFPVSSGTLETIRQLTQNPGLETAGWLDYKMAYESWVRDSILHSEAVQEKAKAENRDLTEDERKSLTDPWGRTAPARSESPVRKIAINYLTMEINDDIATVTLIRGMYYSELKLVLVDKEWYVANERFLSVSP